MGNPKEDLALAIEALERAIDEGANREVVLARLHAASDALFTYVQSGGQLDQ